MSLHHRARVARTQPRHTMNKLEAAYGMLLEAQKRREEIVDWLYEPVTLHFAPRTTYTPDFMVVTNEGEVQFHETKGFMRDDAVVKIKVAAAKFWHFRFFLVKSGKGGWSIEEVG